MSPQIVKSAAQTIKFTKTDKHRIVFDEAVVATFISYTQNGLSETEAGGLLLGRHVKGGSHIAVDIVSEPMCGDKRTRTSFFRGKGHERFAHECWHTSNATCAYLGNWHTHPERNPAPSAIDLHDWNNVLKNDIYEGEYLYFVIVGINGVHCWEGCRQQNEFVQLDRFIFL